MDRRSLPMIIVGCALAVAGIAGYLIPVSPEEIPYKLLMQNKEGRVVFSHRDHSGYKDVACVHCHHEIAVAPPGWRPETGSTHDSPPFALPCGSCHDTSTVRDFAATHQTRYAEEGGNVSCIACHHTRFTGYAKGWSHEDHKDYAADSCQSCHHDKDIEPAPQACDSCHDGGTATGVSLKAAAHTRCMSCHDGLFEDKLKGCKTCHASVPTSEDLAKGVLKKDFSPCLSCHESMPKRMETFHGICFPCHDARKSGPGVEAPCQHCHTPKGR